MKIKFKQPIKLISFLLAIIYFTHLYLASFLSGGRWVLIEQIAFAQRLLEGVASYANGMTDLFFPTSPYFPSRHSSVSFMYSVFVFMILCNLMLIKLKHFIKNKKCQQ